MPCWARKGGRWCRPRGLRRAELDAEVVLVLSVLSVLAELSVLSEQLEPLLVLGLAELPLVLGLVEPGLPLVLALEVQVEPLLEPVLMLELLSELELLLELLSEPVLELELLSEPALAREREREREVEVVKELHLRRGVRRQLESPRFRVVGLCPSGPSSTGANAWTGVASWLYTAAASSWPGQRIPAGLEWQSSS
mmetsp:Transcript_2370/g.10101  ORF Transcript_2370/g.10101 Transcript_2370/m.10101 type:complete len:196 (-) Transcript_2370:746-1333(-)